MGRYKAGKPRNARIRSHQVAEGLLTAVAELGYLDMAPLDSFGMQCMANNYIGVIYISGLGMDAGEAYESWADTCTALRSKPGPPPIGTAVFFIPDVALVEVALAGAELEMTRPVALAGGRSFRMARVPFSMFGGAA
ncbi:hypothetical protein [Streptomyces sp. SPB4]|uniref:hypothetical protein n=1 Tax=Streptomyces sp. SPB4 TaxID=2940553 RepID=UPI002474A2CF|nr:hypothetical protein [Streptomyces sp. SPB4]MDH6537802.1 hypothetical protein [Streptomyces sp. SPB4]